MYAFAIFLICLQSCALGQNILTVSDNDFFNYGFDLETILQNTAVHDYLRQTIKNGKCLIQIVWLLENLRNITVDGLWALQMLDANTKIPAGILNLNIGDWLGNFEECIAIKSKKLALRGNYCLGTIYINIYDWLGSEEKFFRQKARLFAEKKQNFQQAFPTASYPSFGLCIPDGCTADDIEAVITPLKLPFNVPFECQTIDDANPPLTTGAWLTIGAFIIYILIMALSTAYDIYCERTKKEPLHVLFKSFSVHTNSKKLFKTSKNSVELSCLHGIRLLSMMWVIVGHTLSIMITGPVVNTLDVLKYIDTTKSMIFANAVHSVDTFMMVTGLLVVYGYMKSRHMGLKFNLIIFYLHRYLRLTPPFLATIIVSMSLLKYMGSGPHWSFIVNYFQEYCEKSWWSALLYFQNYINVEQWCVGQTWYLNIDWQLYLCAPIFLLTLSWRPKFGVPLLVITLLVSLAVPFYVTWVNELPAVITNLYGDLVNYQNLYYLKTHTRASSWFVGALVGYCISIIKFGNGKVKLNKVTILLMWVIALTLIPICIFVGHDELTSPHYNKLANASYNAFVRPLWAACIAWIVFACSNGYGGIVNKFLSLPIFQVLNRFTYSMYLLHVTMLYMITYASKMPAYFSIFHVAYSFWGITMLSFGLSIFWVLAFESPVIVIEKYFLDMYEKKNESKTFR